MGEDALRAFRDRFKIPILDDEIADAPFYRPPEDSEEIRYMHERRRALGGPLPQRRPRTAALSAPALSTFESQLKGGGEREFSTTMALVRILATLSRDKEIGKLVVPIVPDEARTFGMEGLFRQLGIYAPTGQLYEPVDSDQLMYYREDKQGRILQEGINEAGAISSWMAAGTAYSTHGINMVPFYIFYSMFGFQRIGDLAWAAGDIQARGFLVGGTAGRTTLAGEGLQHDDGHSHLFSANIPNCISYDPTFAYELAVIVQDGMRRMFQEQENVFYYLTVMNENYRHPPMPDGVEEGILEGMYLVRDSGPSPDSNGALRGAVAGQRRHPARGARGGGVARGRTTASPPTFGAPPPSPSSGATECARNAGTCCTPRSRRAGATWPGVSAARRGPVVAASDYVKLFADQIRPYVPRRYVTLGTDGYGAQRHPSRPAALLRGRPALRRALRPQGARRRGGGAGLQRIRCHRALRDGSGEERSPSPPDGKRAPMPIREVRVPHLGDFDDVPVVEVLVGPGDSVRTEEALVTLESDKATMDVPAPSDGVIREISVRVGDSVSEGSLAPHPRQRGAGSGTRRPTCRRPTAQAREGRCAGGRSHRPRPLPPAGSAASHGAPDAPSASSAPSAAPRELWTRADSHATPLAAAIRAQPGSEPRRGPRQRAQRPHSRRGRAGIRQTAPRESRRRSGRPRGGRAGNRRRSTSAVSGRPRSIPCPASSGSRDRTSNGPGTGFPTSPTTTRRT